MIALTRSGSCRSILPSVGSLCFTACVRNTILGFLAGGSTLRDMAAAFAAVPARVLWKLTDKERAETAEPGFPALSANVKARQCQEFWGSLGGMSFACNYTPAQQPSIPLYDIVASSKLCVPAFHLKRFLVFSYSVCT